MVDMVDVRMIVLVVVQVVVLAAAKAGLDHRKSGSGVCCHQNPRCHLYRHQGQTQEWAIHLLKIRQVPRRWQWSIALDQTRGNYMCPTRGRHMNVWSFMSMLPHGDIAITVCGNVDQLRKTQDWPLHTAASVNDIVGKKCFRNSRSSLTKSS